MEQDQYFPVFPPVLRQQFSLDKWVVLYAFFKVLL